MDSGLFEHEYSFDSHSIFCMGRQETHPGHEMALTYTSSGFETVLRGRRLVLTCESRYDTYPDDLRIIAGNMDRRVRLEKGVHDVELVNRQDDSPILVRVLREVQPMRDDPERLVVLKKLATDGELTPPPGKTLKLECIGDSLTSGEGLGAEKGVQAWASHVFSTKGLWTQVLAEKLDADLHQVSQSGWGVLCAWNNDPAGAIPLVYDQVCSVACGEGPKSFGMLQDNDFSEWQPDVIVVNLGTNDGNGFHQPPHVGPDGKAFKLRTGEDGRPLKDDLDLVRDAAKDFLCHLREKNPGAKLIWCYGMCGHEMENTLLAATEAYIQESGDARCRYVSLPAVLPEELAANAHPGPACHEKAAAAVLRAIREME
ncbi:MAG: hypothetical protein IJ083_10675 [Clostridia bacterium]|nr:hypothetical protein [Clostridia bacterium]